MRGFLPAASGFFEGFFSKSANGARRKISSGRSNKPGEGSENGAGEALVPDPGYPVYSRGVWFAGGEVQWMPLDEKTGFLADIGLAEQIPPD